MSTSNKFQQLSDAFLKISQGFSEVASLMNSNLQQEAITEVMIHNNGSPMLASDTNITASDISSTADTDNTDSTAVNDTNLMTTSKPTRKRVKRDPNAPKRPLNSYLLFHNEHYHKLKASNPEMTHSELFSSTVDSWNKLDPEVKMKFEEQGKELLKTFNLEKERYEAANKSKGSSNEVEVEMDKNTMASATNANATNATIDTPSANNSNEISSFNFIPMTEESTDPSTNLKKHKKKKNKHLNIENDKEEKLQ